MQFCFILKRCGVQRSRQALRCSQTLAVNLAFLTSSMRLLRLCMWTGVDRCSSTSDVRRKGQGQSTNITIIINIPRWGVALCFGPSPHSPLVLHVCKWNILLVHYMVVAFLTQNDKDYFTISGLWLIHSLSSRTRLPLTLDLYIGSARLEPRSRRRLS